MDSKYTHFAWISTPRDEGGLAGLKIPLLSDLTKQISKDYGVLLDDVGHTLRRVCVCVCAVFFYSYMYCDVCKLTDILLWFMNAFTDVQLE